MPLPSRVIFWTVLVYALTVICLLHSYALPAFLAHWAAGNDTGAVSIKGLRQTLGLLLNASTGHVTGTSSHRSQTARSAEDEGRWQTVALKNEEFYVYSAFYDDFNVSRPFLRLIGLRRLDGHFKTSTTFCLLTGTGDVTGKGTQSDDKEGSKTVASVPAKFRIIPDHHNRNYTAVFIFCHLPKSSLRPHTVHLASSGHDRPLATLRVIYPEDKPRRNFTVCYSPLFDYGDARHLVEAMELSRLMGAERVLAYRHSVTPAVDSVLQHYVSQGFLHLLPWNIPPVHVHYLGQLAALNDCLYRNFRSSLFLVLCDLDEIIVPSRSRTWSQLVRDLHLSEKKVGAALFRMVFFDQPMGGRLTLAEKGKAELLGLDTLLFTGRQPKPYNWAVRAKAIVVPARVETAGVHFPHRYRPGVRKPSTLKVDMEEAMVHHYRPRDAGTIYDASLLHLAKDLFSNVQAVWREVILPVD